MTIAAIGPLVAEVEGHGPAVVMLPGLGGTANMFQPQMQALAGHRVIRFDLPGSGRAPRPREPLTMDAIAASVIRALAVLGVERAHFVGHSMGTLLCQHIAVTEPRLVGSLFLLGGLIAPGDAARAALPKRAMQVRGGGMTDVAGQIAAHALSAHTRATLPVVEAFVRETLSRQDPEGYALNCEALAQAQAADLKRIGAPTLLLTGEDDAVNPPQVAQALADAIRGAVLVRLDRVGHWASIEAPQDTGRRLIDFVQRAGSRA